MRGAVPAEDPSSLEPREVNEVRQPVRMDTGTRAWKGFEDAAGKRLREASSIGALVQIKESDIQ